jgi:phospholipid/cholesterol/gamma-HCH transport system substrate-binding protein
LIVTTFGITGAFQGATKTFHSKFHNAAGLEKGAAVHYAGSPKIGRVEKLQIDPSDPSLIDITFTVKSDVPVRTDSKVTILSYSPLGDNHLEILSGTPSASLAPSGALLPSKPNPGFSDLMEQVNKLIPQAQELLANLNDLVNVQNRKNISASLADIHKLLNDKNRQNISASLDDLHSILHEDRPVLRSALNNVNAASEKFTPLLDQLRKTIDQVNETLKHADGMIVEDRPQLQESLKNISRLSRRLDQMVDVNSENIDEILENLRQITENLREFSDIIKTQPSSLIHSSSPRQHVPGEHP